VEDNFIVAEKEEKEEEQERNQKALLEEKTENNKNCFDILMNAFECAGFAKEECDVNHLGEVPDKFDEELKFIEEWIQKPYYDECKETFSRYTALGCMLNNGVLRTSIRGILLALSCYNFIYMTYLILEFIFGCRSVFCGFPLGIERFSS